MGDVVIETHNERRRKAAEAAESRARIAAEKLAAAEEARAQLQAQEGADAAPRDEEAEYELPDLDPSELARLAALDAGLPWPPVVEAPKPPPPPPAEPEEAPVEEEEAPEDEFVEFDEPEMPPMPVEEEETEAADWGAGEEEGPAQEVDDGPEFVSRRIIVNMPMPGDAGNDAGADDTVADLGEPALPEGPLSEAEVRQVMMEFKVTGFTAEEALEVAASMQLAHRGSTARRRVESLRAAREQWAQVPHLPRDGEDLDLHEEMHAAAMHAAIIGVQEPFLPANLEERNAVFLRQLLLEDLQALQEGLEAAGMPPEAAAAAAERVQGVEGGRAAIRRCEEYIRMQEQANQEELARRPRSPPRPVSRGKGASDAVLEQHLERVEHLDPKVVQAELAAAVEVFDQTKALADEAHLSAVEARRAASPSRSGTGSRPGSREASRCTRSPSPTRGAAAQPPGRKPSGTAPAAEAQGAASGEGAAAPAKAPSMRGAPAAEAPGGGDAGAGAAPDAAASTPAAAADAGPYDDEGDVDADAAHATAKAMQEAMVDAAEAERKAHEAAIGLQKLEHDLIVSQSRKKLSEAPPPAEEPAPPPAEPEPAPEPEPAAPEPVAEEPAAPEPAAPEPEPAPPAPEPEPEAAPPPPPPPEPEAPPPEPEAPPPPLPEPEAPPPEPEAPPPPPPEPEAPPPEPEAPPPPPPPEPEAAPEPEPPAPAPPAEPPVPKSPARPNSTPSGQDPHPPSPGRPTTAPVRPLSGSSTASSDREEVRVLLQVATRKQFREMKLRGLPVRGQRGLMLAEERGGHLATWADACFAVACQNGLLMV